MSNRTPCRGPIVDARRALRTLDEQSTAAEYQLAEELVTEGLRYAETQIKALPARAAYLRDAITELTAMRETFARTWRPVAGAAPAPVCLQAGVIELEPYRMRQGRST
jgi:hypothetical protein